MVTATKTWLGSRELQELQTRPGGAVMVLTYLESSNPQFFHFYIRDHSMLVRGVPYYNGSFGFTLYGN